MTCRVCGRPIHDPLSISRGIGPVCYERDRIQLRLDFELFEEEEDEKDTRTIQAMVEVDAEPVVGLPPARGHRIRQKRGMGLAFLDHRQDQAPTFHASRWHRFLRWLGL